MASGLLPGLVGASWRGVPFHMPDTSTAPGRRLAEHLFPGIDAAAYDDTGMAPERVSVEGIVLGDDYVLRAQLLRAACARPGPGTLIHPWLGPMRVLLTEPATISFSDRELRMARLSASFVIVGTGLALPAATASRLLAGAGLVGLAALALVTAIGTVTASQARGASARRSSRLVASAWTAASSSARLAGAPAAALARTGALAPAATPDELAARVQAIAAIVAAAAPAAASPVAPAAGTSPVAPTPARTLFEAARAAAGALLAELDVAPAEPDRAAILGAAASAAGLAAGLLVDAPFESRDDALTVRGRIVDLVDSVAEAAERLSSGAFAAPASALSRSLAEARGAAVADINEAIGRLPVVLVVQSDRPIDAFTVAQHLAGDDPARVEAVYRSIVARGRPRHPASLPAGPIEALP